MLPGMDFHKAFQAIDTDNSGEITVEELQEYCKKMNYKETFVQKWLNLFDEDQSGTITYEEFCNTLGLLPKKEVVDQQQKQQQQQQEQQEEQQQKEHKPSSSEGRSRNIQLSGSLMKFSRARMFQRKAIYRLKTKKSRISSSSSSSSSAKASSKSSLVTFKQKEIGGDKNGGSRRVPSRRQPANLPTQVKAKCERKRQPTCFRQQKRRLRQSIKPGSVLLLLAGRHRGKRVVFLRQLNSGLLLVTGPMRLNGCPLRRVNQRFVIATATRVDIRDIKVPERVNDTYFRRAGQSKKPQSGDSTDIFKQEKPSYQPNSERKEDQKSVDSQLMAAIAKSEDGRLLAAYLRSLFCLKRGDRPHAMAF